MSDKKNIEQFFQEKFNHFEAIPSEEVWNDIEAKLDEKKRRRIIPFWWKLSGVAAVFLLGLLVSKSIFTENNIIKSPVITDTNSIQPQNKESNNASENYKNEKVTPLENLNEKVVSNSANETLNSYTKTTIKTSIKQENKNNYSTTEKTNFKKKKSILSKNNQEKLENDIAENNPDFSETEKAIDKEETNSTSTAQNINLDELKNNTSATALTAVEKKINDTVQKNSIVNNALEELLNEKESKTKQESKLNRWQLTSNVAPVFLGSVSGGSPIDTMLVNNSKSYNTSVGFGLGVSYAVNSKLSVRTGLNKLNMSYNTNDILFFTGLESRMLNNVSPTASSEMIQIQNRTTINQTTLVSENTMLPFENVIASKNEGYLNQQIGYLEMPFEMTYALVDKKFGLRVIGGFSTLFLQDNEITIVSDVGNTLLGEATNLNSIHFSTNIGVGMKYSFLKSFEFNIEPTLKYQLNTFSSNAGDFRPYIFGVYSGVSYRF
jgi:hypothetical protein